MTRAHGPTLMEAAATSIGSPADTSVVSLVVNVCSFYLFFFFKFVGTRYYKMYAREDVTEVSKVFAALSLPTLGIRDDDDESTKRTTLPRLDG